MAHRKKLRKPGIYSKYGLTKGNYFVLTLHRPANVDGANKLKDYIKAVAGNARDLAVIFPVHPRTAEVIKKAGIKGPNLCQTWPMGYLDFNYLVENAKAVITVSGGISEETTMAGVHRHRADVQDAGNNKKRKRSGSFNIHWHVTLHSLGLNPG